MSRKRKNQKNSLESQRIQVKELLLKNKIITRNQAIAMGITRLGAIIDNLKNEGYAIEGFWVDDEKSDYAYKLKAITPLGDVKTDKKIVLSNFDNLRTLEEWAATEANKLRAKGKEAVLINAFEPVLDVLSNIFTMPKRNVIVLSGEKQAFINKVAFPIMNVYESVKTMFYENGKRTYLKNRIERIIKKHKNKNAESEKEIVFIIYGLKDTDERDIAFAKYLEQKL